MSGITTITLSKLKAQFGTDLTITYLGSQYYEPFDARVWGLEINNTSFFIGRPTNESFRNFNPEPGIKFSATVKDNPKHNNYKLQFNHIIKQQPKQIEEPFMLTIKNITKKAVLQNKMITPCGVDLEFNAVIVKSDRQIENKSDYLILQRAGMSEVILLAQSTIDKYITYDHKYMPFNMLATIHMTKNNNKILTITKTYNNITDIEAVGRSMEEQLNTEFKSPEEATDELTPFDENFVAETVEATVETVTIADNQYILSGFEYKLYDTTPTSIIGGIIMDDGDIEPVSWDISTGECSDTYHNLVPYTPLVNYTIFRTTTIIHQTTVSAESEALAIETALQTDDTLSWELTDETKKYTT